MIFDLYIEQTLQQLLAQEDTDGDKKITIEDKGPKAFKIEAKDGSMYEVNGTYQYFIINNFVSIFNINCVV